MSASKLNAKSKREIIPLPADIINAINKLHISKNSLTESEWLERIKLIEAYKNLKVNPQLNPYCFKVKKLMMVFNKQKMY